MTNTHSVQAPTGQAPGSVSDRLQPLRRPSGGLAMLAIDQREALREMLASSRAAQISDQQVTDFKVLAARILTPHASAVLIDHQFGWNQVLAAGVTDPACALISSADMFTPRWGELVGESSLDPNVDLAEVRHQGAAAAKLLILWREDESASARIQLATDFIGRCHDNDLAAIIEPVTRRRLDGAASDLDGAIVRAAEELGSLGADLYKAQVPHAGQADDRTLMAACRRLGDQISSPWVVLSSGVAPEDFPRSVRLAVHSGATGFLAGRAIWAPSLAATDLEADLASHAVDRLQRLAAVVDEALAARPA